MNRDVQGEIRKAAKEWEALRSRIADAFPARDSSKEGYQAWSEACAAWHGYRSILDTFWKDDALQRLEAGDSELLEVAIAFVEVDPYYFRSGYLKKRLFRRLRRLTLPSEEKKKILQGVLYALRSHRGDGWKDFCTLAAAFSGPDFAHSVLRFVVDSDPHVARRAKLLLKYVQKDENQAA